MQRDKIEYPSFKSTCPDIFVAKTAPGHFLVLVIISKKLVRWIKRHCVDGERAERPAWHFFLKRKIVGTMAFYLNLCRRCNILSPIHNFSNFLLTWRFDAHRLTAVAWIAFLPERNRDSNFPDIWSFCNRENWICPSWSFVTSVPRLNITCI